MVENMQSLVFENQLASASSLIGRFVGGLDWSGVRLGGTVKAVIRQGDEIALELDSGAFLPISGVETIITQDVLDSIEGSDGLDDSDDVADETDEDDGGESDDGSGGGAGEGDGDSGEGDGDSGEGEG